MSINFNKALKKQFKKEEKKFLSDEKTTTYEMYFLDIVILFLLTTGVKQLATSFGGDVFSWIKAISFEALIAVLIRNITRASIYKISIAGSWFALIGAMIVSIYANINYEWMKYLETDFVTMSGLSSLDTLLHIRACVFSGTLPFMIISVTIGRETIAKSLQYMREKFYQDIHKRQHEEERKERQREYQRNHYKKQKQVKRVRTNRPGDIDEN